MSDVQDRIEQLAAEALEEFAREPEDAARHHSCAFCPSPILATAEDLRWAGWRRRGGYWVCPDCIGEVLASTPSRSPRPTSASTTPADLEIGNEEAMERLQEAVGEVSDALTRHRAVALEWLTNILESCQVLVSAAQRHALPDRCIVGLQKEAAQKSNQKTAPEPVQEALI